MARINKSEKVNAIITQLHKISEVGRFLEHDTQIDEENLKMVLNNIKISKKHFEYKPETLGQVILKLNEAIDLYHGECKRGIIAVDTEKGHVLQDITCFVLSLIKNLEWFYRILNSDHSFNTITAGHFRQNTIDLSAFTEDLLLNLPKFADNLEQYIKTLPIRDGGPKSKYHRKQLILDLYNIYIQLYDALPSHSKNVSLNRSSASSNANEPLNPSHFFKFTKAICNNFLQIGPIDDSTLHGLIEEVVGKRNKQLSN